MLGFPIFHSLVALFGSSVTLDEFDLVIKNARIVDGSGSLWFRGDVGITKGIITSVGRLPEPYNAKEILDANNSYLSPGFIDSHTHDDVAILEKPSHSFKVLQGVTTIITGNCGFSNYPEGQEPLVQDHLRSLLGDVPESMFFKNFSSFRSSLMFGGIGVNVGSLVGHGPLRLAVIGYENREATQAEINAMSSLLEEQLIQGSIGLSLGLLYAPSSYARLNELVSLASIVAKHDRLLSAHIRAYEGGLISSVEEFVNILNLSGARGLLSHLQAAGTPYWNNTMPQALKILEEARNSGIDISVDMYPYLAGSSTILQLLPPSSMSGGINQLLQNLENSTYLQYLKAMVESGYEAGWESKIALIGYNNVVIGSVVNPSLKHFEGKSIVEVATNLTLDEFSTLVQIIKQDTGMTNIIMFQQSQDDNYLVFKSNLQIIGSDSIPRTGGGKPHPRGFGTFPRVLGQYVKSDGIMSLEQAVRKCTWATASRFGIKDRGLIVPGMRADLVLFSDDIMDQATYEEPTLKPRGIQGVWVNGVKVVGPNGELVDDRILPGVVL